MTTNLLELTDTVTKDTEDTLVQAEIRKNYKEIRRALDEGRDYVLDTPRGRILIRAKRAEKSA